MSKNTLTKVPKVIKGTPGEGEFQFPVSHFSYSSLALFSTNPLLFKIRYVNRDTISTTKNISGVIGQAFHKAMEVYWGGNQDLLPSDEAEAIELGMKTGMEFLEMYSDGFIEYSSTIPNKQKAYDDFTKLYASYVKEKPRDPDIELIGCEVAVQETIDLIWKGKRIRLPIPLKGYIDKVERTADGKLRIRDFKTCRLFSDPEKIDGKKIIQTVQYYLLAYAHYGEEPYSIIFEEVKATKNRDGGKQTREYEVVFAENDLFFDFYFRLYDDVTRALAGEAVFVPNIDTFFDNEVGIIAYIHRLDMTDEQAAMMKKLKVDNLTELLQKKIHNAGNMRKLMKTVESKFISARNLNYERMNNEDKIATKLMEHGMMLQFHSKIDGATVELYQYTPSIGLKMGRLKSFAEDVEQVLGVAGVRVLAPIPNSTFVGFEVPKKDRYFPALPEHDGSWNIAIGQTIMGETMRFDLREAPHMLVAGATGSGKSVFLNSIIEQVSGISGAELHLFDPKLVELVHYQDRATEYLSDHKEIDNALENLVIEMEMRYQRLQSERARNISEIEGMKYKVVIIDEFGDLTANNSEVQRNVLLLAQKARAAGIHLVIATQRPSTDVINGTIKANFPTKAVFRVAKEVDSRVVLDEAGAEKLAGKGDMLFASDKGIERLQGFNL